MRIMFLGLLSAARLSKSEAWVKEIDNRMNRRINAFFISTSFYGLKVHALYAALPKTQTYIKAGIKNVRGELGFC